MRPLAVLIVIGALSLGLLSLVDDNVYAWALASAPGVLWLGRFRVASLLVCLALYLFTGPGASYTLPRAGTNWRLAGMIAAVWFIPTLVLVYFVRIPLPHISGTAGFVAFTLTGLLGEELLFRGAIYQLAERALPRIAVQVMGCALPLWPIIVSAALFSLAHLQYYGFHVSGAALGQVSYTLVMGILWGALRPLTGSIWPAIGFHLLTNLIADTRLISGDY